MTSQLALFKGRQLRDSGTQRALGRYAAETLRLVVAELARKGQPFSSEDVLDALPPTTRDSLRLAPNSLGAVIQSEARAGRIKEAGWTRTRHPEGRCRRILLWTGANNVRR